MRGIGDNSAAFGEDLIESVERVIADAGKKLFHYVQWHLADYITGTQGMAPDQEGIYIRFLVRLYDRGKPFPDDDRFMASIMSLDIRKWRRLKADLISFGKITIQSGGLTNARFEKERQKRALELQKQADATKKYWEKKRSEKETSGQLRPDFAPTSPRLPREVSPNYAKKPNEINEIGKHPNQETRDYRLESREEREKEKKSPASSESEYASACGRRDEIEGINGATSLIVGKLAGWINPMMPDRRTAQGWLESSVAMFGATVVRDSFAEVEAKAMQGDVIARPIPLLTKICQQKAAEKPKAGDKPRPHWQKPMTRTQMIKAGIKPDDMPENVWKRLQDDIAKNRSRPC